MKIATKIGIAVRDVMTAGFIVPVRLTSLLGKPF